MRTIVEAGGRRAGSGIGEKERIPLSPFLSWNPLAADSAWRPLAFLIVLADQEPGAE